MYERGTQLRYIEIKHTLAKKFSNKIVRVSAWLPNIAFNFDVMK